MILKQQPPSEPFDEPLDPLTEQALEWLVRLHSGEATGEDWTNYQRWKERDAEAQRAAAKAESLWEQFGPAVTRSLDKKTRRIPVILILAAALTGTAFATGIFGPPASFFANQQTSLGERRSVTLKDGTQLDLDSGTSVDVDVDEKHRLLTLYTGQIFITVKPDPARPFIVRSNNGTIRALGTAFDVSRTGNLTTVVVTEHAVRVANPEEAIGQTVDVQAGHQVSYEPGRGIGPSRPADLHSLTAWRQGQMIFDGRPLGDVVAEMSRYRRGKILITDEAIRRLPVTGIFDTNDPDALLEAITAALPVTVRTFPWITVIYSDSSRRPATSSPAQ